MGFALDICVAFDMRCCARKDLYEFLIKRPKPFYQAAQQSAAKPQKTKSIRFLAAVSGVPHKWHDKMAKGHFIKN